MNFKIKLADKIIELQPHYPDLQPYCSSYIVEEEPANFSFSWSEAEISAEQENDSSLVEYPLPYLETLTALRKIAEQFPYENRLLFHGVTITFAGKGYLFAAPSGTGKSTHISLWRKYLGDGVEIVNGDKPILSVEEKEGGVCTTVYGTPWAGKEGWQKNRQAQLSGICFLRQSKTNAVRRLQPAECLDRLMRQVYLPKDPGAAGLTLELLDRMLTAVPVYLLDCDMSEEAVRCSFEALTGREYGKK